MSFEALYPKPIMALAAAATGAARLAKPDVTVIRVNPLCGDKITLDLEIRNERAAPDETARMNRDMIEHD